MPSITDIVQTMIVAKIYKNALMYSPDCINTISSKDNALKVLKPPQKPVIKKVLYVESRLLFVAKYVKTTVAIKHPKKFAIVVPNGKRVFAGKIRYIIYLTNAPNPPPINTINPFMLYACYLSISKLLYLKYKILTIYYFTVNSVINCHSEGDNYLAPKNL